MPKVPIPEPPRQRPSLVYIAVMRGRDVLTRRVAPALRVVREDGKPPRVEVAA